MFMTLAITGQYSTYGEEEGAKKPPKKPHS